MKHVLKTCITAFMLVMAWGLMNQAQATHLAGAELTYTYLGNNSYRVDVTWIRDCGPGNAQLGSPRITAQGCGYDQTLTPTCVNNGVITNACGPNPCNSTTIVVYEEYTCSVIFDNVPNCPDFTFSTSRGDRNSVITTGAADERLYVEATLNSSNGHHSSPSFGSLPLTTICVGDQFNYNNMGMSNAGGTLSYSLVNALQGPGNPVTYNAGYSSTSPYVGTLNLNSASGALSGTPTQQDLTVMAILVEETDANGNVISSVMRDIQIQVIICTNNAPVATPASNLDTICVGVQYTFTITSDDADDDNVTMSWRGEIAGAGFSIANNNSANPFPTGTFTWTATQADLGNHSYTVTLQDDACPVNGINIYTYDLVVINCCDDFEFNVASCCEVEIETPGSRSVRNSKYYDAALKEIGKARGRAATPDSCDPCIDGWYPVWVEDDNGQPVGFGDPCITVEWLDRNGTVLYTGWAFPATPDVRYTVRVTNTCTGCEWEEDFFFCCESPDPGFTVQTQCTANNFIITVTNITPSMNSQFNLYTAIAPCTAGSCMLDPSNPDDVQWGNVVTFTLPKIAGAMYIIKHGEWTLCDPWQEQRQLVLDTCCLGMDVNIVDWCDMLKSAKMTKATQQKMTNIMDDYSKEKGVKLSATKCDFCENPQIPFIIFAVDDQGTPLDPTVYNISWTSTPGATSSDEWIMANVNEIYYVEAIGPDNCIFRDTFQHVCCEAPENPRCRLDPRRLTPVLSWTPSPVAVSYEIEITVNDPACCRPTGRTWSYTIPVTRTGYAFNFSPRCSSWRVRSICVNGDTSEYSASQCICGLFVIDDDPVLQIGKEKRTSEFGSDLKTYPSPASSFVVLKGLDVQPGASITLLDVSGRAVYTQDVSNEGKETLRTADIPNGIYFIRLQGADNSSSTRKIVIQH